MQFWMCGNCGETIFGSLDDVATLARRQSRRITDVPSVLLLSSAHRCRRRGLPRQPEIRCLDCLRLPTGLCAYHARQATIRAVAPPYVVPWWNAAKSPRDALAAAGLGVAVVNRVSDRGNTAQLLSSPRERNIMSLKLWFVVACAPFVLFALSGCSAVNVFAKPAATPTAVAATDDAALQAVASAVVQAMALVNCKDPQPWETALLDLSNNDGKKFWQANFDNMLKDVIAHKRIARSATVDRVVVAGRETMTNAQGKTNAAAIVLVTGRMDYSDDQGEHTNAPLSQPMLFANTDGAWQFVEFVPPSTLATPTPTKSK